MSLSAVHITPEVFRTCVTHALTTETEEIMGLLLGDVLDRVEASPEQLAQATAAAEHLSESSQRSTRVIGWYHSHPHITVLPSHVDVRTQAMYQGLDEGFIGLIFSVFNQAGDSKAQRVQMTAFQSRQQGWEASIPAQRGSWDFDSSMAAAIAASMDEAKASAATAGQWVQQKVPLAVVPSVDSAEATMRDLVKLCQVLYKEEQHAYARAASEAAAEGDDGIVDPLTAVHQAAEYQQQLARLIEIVLAPALASLRAAQRQAQLQQQQLRDVRDSLALRAGAIPAAEGSPLAPPPTHLRHNQERRESPAGRPAAEVVEKQPSHAPDERKEFPDAAAPLTVSHFGQPPQRDEAPASGGIFYTDWVNEEVQHDSTIPLESLLGRLESSSARKSQPREPRSRTPQSAPAVEAWMQAHDGGKSRNGDSEAAPPSTTSVGPTFVWPTQTNWDADSPLHGGSPVAVAEARGGVFASSRATAEEPPASTGVEGGDPGAATQAKPLAAWQRARLGDRNAANDSPMRPSRESSPGGGKPQRQIRTPPDPFESLLFAELGRRDRREKREKPT